jgi:cytochrome oxidase Cu insertion factor (SCO1/SenC/PrrC family)
MNCDPSSFEPRIHGVTGTEAEIVTIARADRVSGGRRPGRGVGGDTMDHTAAAFLPDRSGRLAGIADDPKSALARLTYGAGPDHDAEAAPITGTGLNPPGETP